MMRFFIYSFQFVAIDHFLIKFMVCVNKSIRSIIQSPSFSKVKVKSFLSTTIIINQLIEPFPLNKDL